MTTNEVENEEIQPEEGGDSTGASSENVIDNSDEMDQDFINEVINEADPTHSPEPESLSEESQSEPDSDTPEAKERGEEPPAEEAPPADAPTSDARAEEASPPSPEVPPEPQAPATDYAEAEKKWLSGLEDRYKISAEDADSLITDPEKMLPKVAARIHAQAMSESLRAVQAALPTILPKLLTQQSGVLHDLVEQSQQSRQKANDFYAENEWAKGQEKLVLQAGQLVDQQFPNLTMDEKLAKTMQIAKGVLGVQDKPKPAAPQPQPAPFRPASAGGSSSAAPAPAETSVWSEFIE